ncbi:MAG TPA: SMI1/KNR4 family protein [Pirellulaceae bacterium]|nr:SMI1/KNR4 family protein [Pirellulaceae bacterium]
MHSYEPIEQRYGFPVPELYRSLKARGAFDHRRGAGDASRLQFYDFEWLEPDGIVDFKFNAWELAVDGGFVPFAITGRHEPYCWRLDWSADGGEPPVVVCERSEYAICLAPNFGGFLYRMAIEAFAGRNDMVATPSAAEELGRAVDLLVEVLPARWSARLSDLRGRSWRRDDKTGSMIVVPWEEAEQLIREDLAFTHLNEKFIHDKDYLKRQRDRK